MTDSCTHPISDPTIVQIVLEHYPFSKSSLSIYNVKFRFNYLCFFHQMIIHGTDNLIVLYLLINRTKLTYAFLSNGHR